MMDCPETSGNLRGGFRQVSSRFPDFSINKKNRKPAGNLRGGFRTIHH